MKKNSYIFNAEVYYILEGEGILCIDEVPIKMHQKQIIYISPNSKQFIENTSPFAPKYFAINQPTWSKENEEIVNNLGGGKGLIYEKKSPVSYVSGNHTWFNFRRFPIERESLL